VSLLGEFSSRSHHLSCKNHLPRVVAMNREERKAPARLRKRRDDRYAQEYRVGDQGQRAKRQQGVGAANQGRGWDDRDGCCQDNQQGCRAEDRRDTAGQGLEVHHQGGGDVQRGTDDIHHATDHQGREGKNQVPPKPLEL
jgi:hypothetical protein